ncbi:hypothetical protein [Paenibacillus sp.]|jgi:hypothetical protein|uniref:hypothetical protein n=1 Tax=Paenibacillus sp. TaxID=58172 RepID=UPI002839E53C|nr:hypothetical protein [Paenibacillus sp.]MDR0266766.1 hypothetical protein [Paenibacillus sp.]
MSNYWDQQIIGYLVHQKRECELTEGIDTISEMDWIEMVAKGDVCYKHHGIKLKKQRLFNNALEIPLPIDLTPVSKGFIEKEGDTRIRDQYFFMNSTGEISCGIHLGGSIETEIDLEMLKDCMMIESKNKKPEIKLFELENESLKQRGFETYDCLIPTEHGQFYQFVFLTVCRDRLLQGCFQFKAELADLWRPMSAAIIQTIIFFE